MTELNKMKNIGKELEWKLQIIGINPAEELKFIGRYIGINIAFCF